jgi:nitrile hydratase
MDGIHDLGGKQGFGRVEREVDEPVFHERWEAAVFGISVVAQTAGVVRNIDQFRHAVERIDPCAYLDHGYYGRWLGGLEALFVEAGILASTEVDARARLLGAESDDLIAARPNDDAATIDYAPLAAGAARELSVEPRFDLGDSVRTRSHGVAGHTRLPAYVRGRTGTIVAGHGGWIYPDSNAHGQGEAPEHLYTVAFSGTELWGEDAEPGVTLNIDLFEPYLEPNDD